MITGCNCLGSKNPGTKFRWRQIESFEEFGGKPCHTLDGKPLAKGRSIEEESKDCLKGDQVLGCKAISPTHNAVSQWTDWTVCQVDCSKSKHSRYGQQTRSRTCFIPEKCKNKKMSQTQKCISACKPMGKAP